MPSIKQNPATLPLPDFRNCGVMLRILLGVNLLAAAAALVQSSGLGDALRAMSICGLGAAAAAPEPRAAGARRQCAAPFAAGRRAGAGSLARRRLVGVAARFRVIWASAMAAGRVWRARLLGALVAGVLLAYFALRAQAFSPALAEARLLVLTARIRPHFLFNSLNAILSLIRAEPRRAESAGRTRRTFSRADARSSRPFAAGRRDFAMPAVPQSRKLRLGERLNVEWEIVDVPADLEVLPLMLQPLLENAVYHGIEPLGEPATIHIRFVRSGDELHVDLANPSPRRRGGAGRQPHGAGQYP